MSTQEPGGTGGPDEGSVPSQDPIEEIAHTAEDVAEGELLDAEIVIEGAGGELEPLTAERGEYPAPLQRTQAEIDNYRKRVLWDQTAHLARSTAGLVGHLRP